MSEALRNALRDADLKVKARTWLPGDPHRPVGCAYIDIRPDFVGFTHPLPYTRWWSWGWQELYRRIRDDFRSAQADFDRSCRRFGVPHRDDAERILN